MLAHGLIESRVLEAQIGLLPAADQRERAGQIFTVVQTKVFRDRP